MQLSGTIYLPPSYKPGERLPMIVWAYPREFGDADSAGGSIYVAGGRVPRERPRVGVLNRRAGALRADDAEAP